MKMTNLLFKTPVLILLITVSSVAYSSSTKNSELTTDNHNLVDNRLNHRYLPYLQLGTTQLLGDSKYNIINLELFSPVWQHSDNMIFTNLKSYHLKNQGYMGGAYFGYRHLAQNNQAIYGIYSSFDYQKEDASTFKQITIGLEHWANDWFIGVNFYKPIGNTKIYNSPTKDSYLISLAGLDTQIGKEFRLNHAKFSCYLVGYYYSYPDETKPVYGAKIRASYEWIISHKNQPISNIRLNNEVRYDRLRGKCFILGIQLRLSLPQNNLPNDVTQHMLDPIYRDSSLIFTQNIKQNTALSQLRIQNHQTDQEERLAAMRSAFNSMNAKYNIIPNFKL